MKNKQPSMYIFDVSGKPFLLSHRNLNSDGPNKLSRLVKSHPDRKYFTLDTNPEVFHIIHRHLQGYSLLEISDQLLDDVTKDAYFYGLYKLLHWCNTLICNKTQYNKLISNKFVSNKYIEFENTWIPERNSSLSFSPTCNFIEETNQALTFH